MKGKKVILGVSASVAIYRALELIRMLQQEEVDVEVVMTPDAQNFIRPLMFEALIGRESWCDPFSPRMPHIHLSRGAHAIVVAPATMDFINKLSVGICDQLLLSLCQASKVPIVIAPAMNPEMFANSSTQESVQRLKARGLTFVMPDDGMALCGETGPGRLAELDHIMMAIRSVLDQNNKKVDKAWQGKPVLVTAGPTRNYLDPIRFISNGSSGRMGIALARVLMQRGAHVQLALSKHIEAPNDLDSVLPFETHDELAKIYRQFIQGHQEGVIFAAAAPSDFSVKKARSTKRPKQDLQTLALEPLPDLLQTTCSDRPKAIKLVGFCAETEMLKQKAMIKMKQKTCDFMVANGPSAFGSPLNSGLILSAQGNRDKTFERISKEYVACQICDFVGSV